MRRALALGVAAVLCMAVVALAGDDKMGGDKGKMGGKMMEGTISKVDMAGKMMMVKGADGKDSAVYWNDTTKVEGGDLKEGSKVHYKGETKDGKMWASWVHVGEMKKM
jgi:Cu/Ag efflux protein CusF